MFFLQIKGAIYVPKILKLLVKWRETLSCKKIAPNTFYWQSLFYFVNMNSLSLNSFLKWNELVLDGARRLKSKAKQREVWQYLFQVQPIVDIDGSTNGEIIGELIR